MHIQNDKGKFVHYGLREGLCVNCAVCFLVTAEGNIYVSGGELRQWSMLLQCAVYSWNTTELQSTN